MTRLTEDRSQDARKNKFWIITGWGEAPQLPAGPREKRPIGRLISSITIMEASDWSKNIIADLAYLSNSKTNSRDGGQVES